MLYAKLSFVMFCSCVLGACSSVPTCSNVLSMSSYKSMMNQYGYTAVAESNTRCYSAGSYNNQNQADEEALKTCASGNTGNCDLYAEGSALTDWGRQREQQSQQAFESDMTNIVAMGNQLAAAKATGQQERAAVLQQQAAQQQLATSQQQAATLRQQQVAALQAQQLVTQQQQLTYAQQVLQQQQTYATQISQQQKILAAQSPATGSQTSSGSRSAGAPKKTYHPAFSDQGVVVTDPDATIDGVPGSVSDFIVRITNTGDVRLNCQTSAKARLTYTTGGSCIGISAVNCANGRFDDTTTVREILPGQTIDTAKLRYYLGDGTYQTSCNGDPTQ